MRDLTDVTIAYNSVIEPGTNDFALFYNLANNQVLAAVTQIDTAPITELRSSRTVDFYNLKTRDRHPKKATGY